MKKFLAIILVLVMCFSFVACNSDKPSDDAANTDGAGTSDPVNTGDNSTPSNTGGTDLGGEGDGPIDTGSEDLDLIGMYNPDYDYSQNPTYKVAYVVLATGVLYEAFGTAFEHWCSVMNMEYLGLREFAGDKDAYLTGLTTIAREADGLLIDPDAQMYTRCAEILDELGKPWMGCMAAPRDYEQDGMPLLHPFVGFDNYQVGTIMVPKLLEFKEELWPDVDWSEVGFITVDFSISPPLHDRERGAYDTLSQLQPELLDNYFVADTAINTFDVDTSSQVVSSVLATNPHIEYWLIFAEVDTMAQGSAAAVDTVGLTDTSAVVTFGGTGLQLQWDSGTQDAWRAACYLPQTLYAEPIIGALYAYMSGQAEPNTIWPSWCNVNDQGGEDGPYASRLLPAFWIEYDNYKAMIKWSDVYSNSNFFPDYPADGLTRDSYSAAVTIPASYSVAN